MTRYDDSVTVAPSYVLPVAATGATEFQNHNNDLISCAARPQHKFHAIAPNLAVVIREGSDSMSRAASQTTLAWPGRQRGYG